MGARRLLKQLKIDVKANAKVDGNVYNVMDKDFERKPFKAYLDVGLVRTTTGNRVFGAMKGATDGGLFIPHNEKRFPGFKVVKQEVQTNKRGKKTEEQASKTTSFDAKKHVSHIFGQSVQDYYDSLKKEGADALKKQFSKWTECLNANKAKNIPEVWKKVHAAIQANPDRVKKAKAAKPTRKVVAKARNGGKWLREQKTSKKVKQAKIDKIVTA